MRTQRAQIPQRAPLSSGLRPGCSLATCAGGSSLGTVRRDPRRPVSPGREGGQVILGLRLRPLPFLHRVGARLAPPLAPGGMQYTDFQSAHCCGLRRCSSPSRSRTPDPVDTYGLRRSTVKPWPTLTSGVRSTERPTSTWLARSHTHACARTHVHSRAHTSTRARKQARS